MKSKIGVEIHKDGSSNVLILKAVSKHNGEDNVIDRETLSGYIMGQKIEYTSLFKDLKIIDEGDTMHISEDGGKTFTLSLTWKEVEELKETVNDIPEELFTQTQN